MRERRRKGNIKKRVEWKVTEARGKKRRRKWRRRKLGG